jgi:hypothetical protein
MATGTANGYASRDDLLQASKALHDRLAGELTARAKAMESAITLSVGNVLGERFDARVDGVFVKRLTAEIDRGLSKLTAEFEAKALALDSYYAEREKALRDAYEHKATDIACQADLRVQAVEGAFETRLKAMELLHTKALDRMQDFMAQAAQAAQAQVAALVDRLSQLVTPVVHNHIPAAIPPEVTVNPTPVTVEVAVPEQKAPVVNVKTPRREKEHLYDGHGRPWKTIEKDMEE